MFNGAQVCNELEAYLLGFFYADGCVTQYKCGSYRRFNVTLSEKDKEYLQWMTDILNQHLNTTYNLKYVESNKAYCLSIYRVDFINNLIQLGVNNNKTYENDSFVFDNVPDNLKRHFIRGYLDGDGSITNYLKDNNYKCHVNLVSLNHKLISAIRDYVYNIFKFGSVRIDKKYSRYQLSGNVSTKKFLDWIYNEANYYMQRKYKKYIEMPPPKYKNRYKGIRYSGKRYRVDITYNGKKYYIGTFNTIKEALEVYNTKAIECNFALQEYKGEKLYEDE